MARFQFGDGKQILDEQFEALSIAVDGLQEFGRHPRVIPRAIQQRLDVAFDEGKGGAKLMADVGDKFLPYTLELLKAGQIVEDQNGAVPLAEAIADGGGVDLQPALAQPRELQLVSQRLFLRVEGIDQVRELVQAQRLHEGAAPNVDCHTKQV